MGWEKLLAAGALTALVWAGCAQQFAHYRLKGVRSRNLSYLLAAIGLLFFFLALLGTAAVRAVIALLSDPGVRFGCFLGGCVLLLGAVGMFLYLTYLRPSRLQFEDRMIGELPRHPPDE